MKLMIGKLSDCPKDREVKHVENVQQLIIN